MTQTITDPEFTPKVRDDLVFRQLDEEWVVFDPLAEQLHVLNASAAVVWVCCTGDSSVREIVDAVEDAFDDGLARDQIEEDVAQTLRSFVEKGLLQ